MKNLFVEFYQITDFGKLLILSGPQVYRCAVKVVDLVMRATFERIMMTLSCIQHSNMPLINYIIKDHH
jgi:hypothetical protein